MPAKKHPAKRTTRPAPRAASHPASHPAAHAAHHAASPAAPHAAHHAAPHAAPHAKEAASGTLHTVHGQPSWRLATPDVELWVTETGGHLGPVTFDRRGRKLTPYHVAPWAEEPTPDGLAPILKVLRGDFFCLPFGGNATPYNGEKHPVHGETANAKWHLAGAEKKGDRHSLRLTLKTSVRHGRVEKIITLVEGHPALYCRHVLSGFKGPLNPGHHAMLRFPDEPGSGRLSTSNFVYGQVYPGPLERPEEKGYQSLRPGAEFTDLGRVAMLNGEAADLTRYPARRGFEDLALIVADDRYPWAWTAVAFPKQRYVWFALKDPHVLRATIFWFSNGGRHYPPWNGRHVNVLGLEEVTSFFHTGLAESAAHNALVSQGYPTCLQLDPAHPTAINYIMACVPVPAGFDHVVAIELAAGGAGVQVRSGGGQSVTVPLDLDFLRGRA